MIRQYAHSGCRNPYDVGAPNRYGFIEPVRCEMVTSDRDRLLQLCFRPACLLLALWLPACSWLHRTKETGVTVSEVTSVSRVVIPSNGGQTIVIPRLMRDATQLWSPLSKSSRSIPTKTLDMELQTAGGMTAWLPSTEYDIMRRYLYRLTHEQKALASRVLARADKYLPTVRESLSKRGLPLELASLPLVESAFEPQAVSPAGAAGLWQLMPQTARRFGLVVNSEVDERFDVYKSTEAATEYLAFLYGMFGDWPLALAAYNCGEGAMRRALNQANCTTLEGVTTYCRVSGADNQVLREETLRFVPQFAAAVLIMQQADGRGLSSAATANSPGGSGVGQHTTDGRLKITGKYDDVVQPAFSPQRITRIQ